MIARVRRRRARDGRRPGLRPTAAAAPTASSSCRDPGLLPFPEGVKGLYDRPQIPAASASSADMQERRTGTLSCRMGLDILRNLDPIAGAVGARCEDGEGCGLLIQIPHPPSSARRMRQARHLGSEPWRIGRGLAVHAARPEGYAIVCDDRREGASATRFPLLVLDCAGRQFRPLGERPSRPDPTNRHGSSKGPSEPHETSGSHPFRAASLPGRACVCIMGAHLRTRSTSPRTAGSPAYCTTR